MHRPRKTMYPKVKVRELEEDDLFDSLDSDGSVWSMDGFESLPLPVNDFEDDTPSPIARIPRSYVANSSMSMMPVSKGSGKKNNKKAAEDHIPNMLYHTPSISSGSGRNNSEKAAEDHTPNTRESPILRPRAVLSSPDNDEMIRSRNKINTGLLSGLKAHSICQNRHGKCKVVPRPPDVSESPVNTGRRLCMKSPDSSKMDLKGAGGSNVTKPHLFCKGKPRPSWI